MKVFLDTNIVVSAFATRGLCADLLNLVLAEHELVLGETVLEEVRRVLRDKLRMPRGTIDQIEAFLRRQAAVSTHEATPRPAGLDAADAKVVAVAGQVDVLVTGDQELLQLRESPVEIVSPRGLWDRLRRATERDALKPRDGAAAVKEVSSVVGRPPRRRSFKRRLGATLKKPRNSPHD